MVSKKNTQSRLRETLKQEDSSLAERLPAPPRTPAAKPASRKTPTAAPAARQAEAKPPAASGAEPKAASRPASVDRPPKARSPATEKTKPGKTKADKDRHEKVARDSFSMPASEHKRIKALRDALAQAGYEASKSEVLRAGVALLASRGLGEIINLVGDLPKVPKGKRGKKH
jgi:hypothetical protein